MSIVARIVEPGGFDRYVGAAVLTFVVFGVAVIYLDIVRPISIQ